MRSVALLVAMLTISLGAQVTSQSKPTTGVEADPGYLVVNRPRALALIGDIYTINRRRPAGGRKWARGDSAISLQAIRRRP